MYRPQKGLENIVYAKLLRGYLLEITNDFEGYFF